MQRTRLVNARIWNGVDDDYAPSTSVTIADGRIMAIGDDAPFDAEVDLGGRALLPGFIDAHFHAYAALVDTPALEQLPLSYLAHHATRLMADALHRGFTTVRDAAGADYGLQEAQARGIFEGPRLFIAGAPISQTGGHADQRPKGVRQRNWFCNCAGLGLVGAIADGVGKCFLNSGQTCTALTRMIVPRSRLAEVEQAAAAAAAGFTPGNPFEKTSRLGPLVSAAQRDRVRGFIQTGIDEGATLVAGGPDAPAGLEQGYFVQPTVFSNVTRDMTIAREEIFGPVLSIIPYDTEDEAIDIANDTVYGLAGGVWGEPDHAKQVARKIRAGQVEVNGGAFNVMAPFGGYKQSGLGREAGTFGLEEFLEVKSLQL